MLLLQSLVSIISAPVLFGLFLFLPAGTLDWWRAWVFLGVVLIATVVTMAAVFRDNEGLLRERFKPPIQKGQPFADKIVTLAFIAAFWAFTSFISLDVFGFHLLPKPDLPVSSFGLLLFLAGWTIIAITLRQNAFAAPVVKHQKERRQTVVDSGVYAVVRHPMYSGAILLMIGMPLWLESYPGALAAAVPIATIVARLLVEERFLRRELEGYAEYTRRVRYRLIPRVW